jgi:hypothetical protein
MHPLVLGQPRDKIKADAIIESAYVKNGEELIEKKIDDDEKASNKGQIRMFGYKHYRAMKFYG